MNEHEVEYRRQKEKAEDMPGSDYGVTHGLLAVAAAILALRETLRAK